MKRVIITLIVLGLDLCAWAQTGTCGSNGFPVTWTLNAYPEWSRTAEPSTPAGIREVLVLSVDNTGTKACTIPDEVRDRDSTADPEVKLVWRRSDPTRQDTVLAPQEHAVFTAEWAGAKPGNYTLLLQPGPTQLPPDFELRSTEILVTGTLMGYYRLPNQQSFRVNPGDVGKCVGSIEQASDDAQVFLNLLNDDKSLIRVGTGDNFAPNYYSRVFKFDPCESEQTRGRPSGKDFYTWSPVNKSGDEDQCKPSLHWTWYGDQGNRKFETDARQGLGVIPTDNVACFLSRAHYDAVVPGKHDFYFGPERLRELARFLANIKPDGPKGSNAGFLPVQMLGANMVIKTKWADADDHKPVPDREKRNLGFVTQFATDSKTDTGHSLKITSISDGDEVFPWMRKVKITSKGWSPDQFSVYLCAAEPDHPDTFLASEDKKAKPDSQKVCLADGSEPLKNEPVKDEPVKDEPVKNDPKQRDAKPRNLVYLLPPLPSPQDASKPDTKEPGLQPGQNYGLCVVLNQSNNQPSLPRQKYPYCIRFSVRIPFFQYPNWPDGGPKTVPEPYMIKYGGRGSGNTPVAIFGIVDPQLLENVGGENYTWETIGDVEATSPRQDNRYLTQVAVVDPVPALAQLQEYFEEQHPQFRGIRVLITEMTPDRAKQLEEHLPANLRFDVVVSASDDDLATPNQVVQIHPARLPKPSAGDNANAELGSSNGLNNGAFASPGTFLIVPPSHQIQSQERLLQARHLRVSSDGTSHWNYDLFGDPVPIKQGLAQLTNNKENKTAEDLDSEKLRVKKLKDSEDHFWEGVCTALNRGQNQSPCDAKDASQHEEAIQQLALWSMRKKWDADIALLQKRDFYIDGVKDYLHEDCDASKASKDPCKDFKDILDRVIWKGDNVRVLSVKGSTLQSIIKDSDQFETIENKGYLPVSEGERSLVMLGLRPDPRSLGDYLVNGKPLDANALYSVVTSNYIALGDTGYAELVTPPVGHAPNPASPEGVLLRISSLVCDEIDPPCNQELSRLGYFDLLKQAPADPRTGNTHWRKLYVSLFSPLLGLGQPSSHPAGPGTIGEANQHKLESRSNWEWSLDKLSIGFSGLAHTYSEQALSQQFAGVLTSDALAAHTHEWDWKVTDTFTRFNPKVDLFLSQKLEYSSVFTAQLGAPASESQSVNQLTFDEGAYVHLAESWNRKELPQFSLALYSHVFTQAGNPIASVNLNAVGNAPASTLTFRQGRVAVALGRAGLRWQDRKSYAEGGLEGGQTLNAIQQFNVSGTPLHCTLGPGDSLTTCLNNFNQAQGAAAITPSSSITTSRGRQDRYGTYWKLGITVPVSSKVSYGLEETSDYFFLSAHDNSADTRFAHRLENSVKFSVFPNLSFEPTYTIFLFENKIDYNFLLQQQVAVKINYSFHVSNWRQSQQGFRYKKPESE